MTDKELTRFIKVMQLTQSPNDNEVLSAVRRANTILAKHKFDWERFIMGIRKAAFEAGQRASQPVVTYFYTQTQ